MFFRSRTSSSSSRNTNSSIEPLEARVAPAGIINVQIVGGNVVIKADAATDGDSQITLSTAAPPNLIAALQVTPDATTALRFEGNELAPGASLQIPVFAGISIALGAGADTVILNAVVPKTVSIDLGSGVNSAVLGGTVGGKLVVKGGDGADMINLSTGLQAGADVTLALGNGANSLVAGNSVELARNLIVTTGAGADTLNPAFGENSRISGNVTINSGAGADTVGLFGNGPLTILGSIGFKSLGGSDVTVRHEADAETLIVGGSVSFSIAKASSNDMRLGKTSSTLVVGGGVTFKSAQTFAGTPEIFIGSQGAAQIGKSISVTAGKNAETAIWGIGNNSYFGGSITVKGGSEINIVSDGLVAEKLSFTTSTTALASILVTNGVGGTLRVMGAVTLNSSSSNNGTTRITNSYFGSSVGITNGAGGQDVIIEHVTIAGALAVNSGAGEDVITVGTEAFVRVGGAIKILAGDGADTIFLGANAMNTGVFGFGPVLVDAGPGTDLFGIGAQSVFVSQPVVKNVP